jgi:hypothetical protein
VTRTWIILTVGVLAAALPAYGHHSFAAYYLEDQSIAVEGDLVQIDYLNPHAWLHLAAADKSGQVQKVSGEWSNPGRLNSQGITKDTLKPGDRLIFTGSPSRDPAEYKMHLKRIERPSDGWKWIGRGQPR